MENIIILLLAAAAVAGAIATYLAFAVKVVEE